jgi:uncharacterized membrane protein YbhN (UPF0104 family)
MPRKERTKRSAAMVWLKRLLPVVAIALAAFLIYRTLHNYSLDDIVASIKSIPLTRLAFAVLFAASSYFCLSWFDWFGLRYAGKPQPYRRAALASFCALSLGHNIGFAALSSGAVRYRFYSRWGLSAGDVARVILFTSMTVGVGMITLGGIALLARSDLAGKMLGIAPGIALAGGILCLTVTALYLLAAAFVRGEIRIRYWRVPMPPLKLALAQIVIGPANYACVAGCLHQTLSAAGDVPYLPVAAAYVIANTSALITHVPGGLGVVESIVMFLLPGTAVIGALLMFRVCYYLLPLCIGGPLFLLTEIYFRRKKARS